MSDREYRRAIRIVLSENRLGELLEECCRNLDRKQLRKLVKPINRRIVFLKDRETRYWWTRGRRMIYVKDLDTQHIKNILNQTRSRFMETSFRNLLKQELEYRKEQPDYDPLWERITSG